MSACDSIFITGGGGMLAHALIRALKRRGHSVLAPSHAEFDITNDAALRDFFAHHRPTLVLNCAAHTKVDRCEQQEDLAGAVNGHAVATLARLVADHNA